MEDSVDSSYVDCLLPVARTAKCVSVQCDVVIAQLSLPRSNASSPAPFQPSSHLPALVPRDECVKLFFNGKLSTDTKLRWLCAVTRTFQLRRGLVEVKMASVTSQFVYISTELSLVSFCLSLIPQDSPEKPRKYPSYIITRFPVGVDPNLAQIHPGVYSARRFIQNSSSINHIVVVWCLIDPPPPVISFDFLLCLLPCDVRKLHNDKPWCYKCWSVGHNSRYCLASPKCVVCAADHESNSELLPLTATFSTSELPPLGNTSRWKCPRYLQPEVNVWHGCARRQSPTSASATTPPPPPPPLTTQSAPLTNPASPLDLDLRKSVDSLMVRCKALQNCFTNLETIN